MFGESSVDHKPFAKLFRRCLINDLYCRVPPNIYKKVKQASEDEREGVLLKELESILKREGLSAGASKDGMRQRITCCSSCGLLLHDQGQLSQLKSLFCRNQGCEEKEGEA